MALSLVGSIALGGCSTTTQEDPSIAPVSSDAATMDASPADATTTPAESESAPESPAAETPAAEAPALPEGSQWAESSTQGIRFAVPDTWKTVDATKTIAAGDEAAIESAASDMGLTADQLRQAAESIDIIIMGPVVDQFAPNVNVVPNTLSALPPLASLKAEAESVGAVVGEGSTIATPLGDAIVLPYVLELEAAAVQGRAIVAPVAGGFTSITVSHVTEEEADALTEQILTTLQEL